MRVLTGADQTGELTDDDLARLYAAESTPFLRVNRSEEHTSELQSH